MSEETLLEFPCEFPIKIMGRESAEFRQRARALVEKHTGELQDESVNYAVSRNGSFVSVTITVPAQSQDQLDAIYRDVSGDDAVLMAL